MVGWIILFIYVLVGIVVLCMTLPKEDTNIEEREEFPDYIG